MSLDEYIEQREIVICCGAGGVGKTTTAAAIGLEAARRGKKVLVLTIDPARRLASAMGLKELGNAETRIKPEVLAESGIELDGELWGMMLDTKRTWDELIDRISPSPEKRDLILSNQYYQIVSSALAGSQEYMAMEKLQEIHASGVYDLIVLDTPPTKHALDFLEAPRRMSDFLEGRVIQILIKPYALAGKAGFKLLHRGTATLMSLMEKVTGMGVMKDLADFFLSFDGLYDGFKDRALRVNQLLRSRRTTFLLVTSPSPLILREATFFTEKLIEFGMPLGAILFNRVHPGFLTGTARQRSVKKLLKDKSRQTKLLQAADLLDDPKYAQVLTSLLENVLRAQMLADADRNNIERFINLCRGVSSYQVPFFEEDVHDFTGLEKIARRLFNQEA